MSDAGLWDSEPPLQKLPEGETRIFPPDGVNASGVQWREASRGVATGNGGGFAESHDGAINALDHTTGRKICNGTDTSMQPGCFSLVTTVRECFRRTMILKFVCLKPLAEFVKSNLEPGAQVGRL
ncbi:hypothetical protein OCU04_012387 [Sclerotinia nivalis]|uniref:Uncharacterized protein n=1 Tax=Sclerotinia nivalis TaxID=352851 RepID=A0A9X0DEU1_9HELO|nr:hypothetical protein OCU04_012387 [Sclerotinia nivalis]